MNTGATVDQDSAYIKGGVSPVLHLDPDCPAAKRAKRLTPIPTDHLPNNPVCRRCDPDVTIDRSSQQPRGDCRACAGTLDEDGDCPFCERFEAVMGA